MWCAVRYNIHITNVCVANLYLTCTRRHINQGRLAYCLYINCKNCPCGKKFNTTTFANLHIYNVYVNHSTMKKWNYESWIMYLNWKLILKYLWTVCMSVYCVWSSRDCVWYLLALIFILSGCRVFVYAICLLCLVVSSLSVLFVVFNAYCVWLLCVSVLFVCLHISCVRLSCIYVCYSFVLICPAVVCLCVLFVCLTMSSCSMFVCAIDLS